MSRPNPAQEVGQIMTIELDRSGSRPKHVDVRPETHDAGVQEQATLRSGKLGRMLLVGLVALAMIAAPSVGFAGEKAAETGREGGLGAAAAISSLVYGPVKLLYATGGLVVGAFAWAFTAGDTQVAEKVFTRSLRGTYVITPDILTGERELVFIGRDVDEPRAHTAALASASTGTAGIDAPSESIDDNDYDEMGW
jgi:hypothetical protein